MEAMALAPAVPDIVASSVASFCEMAPGVPYSQQLLDDILEGLQVTHEIYISAQHLWGDYYFNSLDTPGFAFIDVRLFCIKRKAKGATKQSLEAQVTFKAGGINDAPPNVSFQYENATFAGCKEFPFDREGLKAAIEYLQMIVQNLKRCGLCAQCLAMARPVKRLRVGQSGLCGSCLLGRAVF